MTKYFLAVIAFAITLLEANGQERQLPDRIKLQSHPRILLLKGEERSIRDAIARDPVWRKMHEAIKKHCDMVIDSPVLERVPPAGPLLNTLNTSRKALRRIFFLSY